MARFIIALCLIVPLTPLMPLTGCGSSPPPPGQPWLSGSAVAVDGLHSIVHDCRVGICKHNENTDLINWNGAIWMVHRSAESQLPGPNSALHVYRRTPSDAALSQTAMLAAPAPGTVLGGMAGRDLRDPHFYVAGGELYLKALARLPVNSQRDENVDSATIITHSANGTDWSPFLEVAPRGFSFWRVKQSPQGVYYSAAYADGDVKVTLFSSKDGVTFTQGSDIYSVAADTPLETELSFLPSGRLLALVRLDGTTDELLGTSGRLRTRICWALPPYVAFDCVDEFTGQRLDGPLTFFWQGRLFSIARKHLMDGRKRTALFEIGGTLEGGPLTIRHWSDLPSAGDTSYAGVATLDANRLFVSWYSGDVALDDNWVQGMLAATDVRTAAIDLSKLQ